jgi:acyl-CoA thioesterase FadM
MYPFVRMAKELFVHRKAGPLGFGETHVSRHICWPWDLDMWMELNNGRTLTLYDLGRIPLGQRTGLVDALRGRGWGLTIAGSAIRYRRRVRMFDVVEMRSRAVGWDARFIYLEQSMWRADECTSHAIYRAAVTSPNGIVPPDEVVAAMGLGLAPPGLPAWVEAWIAAENQRPWPPEM